MNGLFFATALLSAVAIAPAAIAQTADPTANADPACVVSNSDGTKALDTVKCKDGKPLAVDPAAAATPATDPAQTAATTPATAGGAIFVAPDRLSNATIMSASDFVGKRVYATDGADIGEVNDFFVTNDGKVQGVVVGVGGFLGIGEKDVVVSMQSIQMQAGDAGSKLVIKATKEELNAAPAYDRSKRIYMQ